MEGSGQKIHIEVEFQLAPGKACCGSSYVDCGGAPKNRYYLTSRLGELEDILGDVSTFDDSQDVEALVGSCNGSMPDSVRDAAVGTVEVVVLLGRDYKYCTGALHRRIELGELGRSLHRNSESGSSEQALSGSEAVAGVKGATANPPDGEAATCG